MQIFLVGGAVRDQLLNYPTKDRDWVVVGSSVDEMNALGYQQVGQDFPVFLHPDTKEEYALARTERKSGHGYKGFAFDASKQVSLEEDLMRRDLTINAMAMSEDGKLIDPYNGKNDLDNKILRHVSDSFIEDPLRVLRVARFASRYSHLGFTIAPETIKLMQDIVQNGETQHLTPERVWQETERSLREETPEVYFQTLRDTGCLKTVFPEIDKLFGIPQPPKYHPEIDTGIHALLSLRQACLLSQAAEVRFAALVHDLGKARTPSSEWPSHHGHEQLGKKPIDKLCTRSRVPNDFKALALMVSEFHTHVHRALELKPSTILKTLKQCDAFRRPDRFEEFLLCCEADAKGRPGFEETPYPQADLFREVLTELNLVTTKEIIEKGYKGKEIGLQLDIQRTEKIAKVKQGYKC